MQKEILKTIDKLKQYPNFLTKSQMIQVNHCCYMPVTIKHTNQVKIHIGYDYFIMTSASKAIEILQRRMEHSKKYKNKYQYKKYQEYQWSEEILKSMEQLKDNDQKVINITEYQQHQTKQVLEQQKIKQPVQKIKPQEKTKKVSKFKAERLAMKK